jgi:hypothetical protein
MNEKTANQKALEELVVENPDLERLEYLLGQFNFFEAIKAIRVEVRHSAFLAFLLTPSENHGLGDLLLKGLLKKALSSSIQSTTSINPIDIDVWGLDNTTVACEWQNIDIFLLDEANKLAVIMENKIDSTEHGDQLTRYWQIVSHHYPGYQLIGLYLTPEGDIPSVDAFIPIDYASVCETLEQLVRSRSSEIKQDVIYAIAQYTQMLRRHIMEESEIADLCRKIYRKHRRALDAIYEYRPDLQEEIQEVVEELIKAQPELALDHSSKSYIRFAAKEWEKPLLLQGDGWTRSKRILLFEFYNYPDRLTLHLTIGPGPKEIRNKLFELAKEHKPPFKPAFKTLGKNFNTIYTYSFLRADAYDDMSQLERDSEIKGKWKQFMDHGFSEITSALRKHKWE